MLDLEAIWRLERTKRTMYSTGHSEVETICCFAHLWWWWNVVQIYCVAEPNFVQLFYAVDPLVPIILALPPLNHNPPPPSPNP